MIECEFRLANPCQRFAFIFCWVINNSHLPLDPFKFIFCVNTAFNIVLIHILDALQLILFLVFFSAKVVEEFDKSVVRHVISRVDEAISLLFDIVLIVFVLFI